MKRIVLLLALPFLIGADKCSIPWPTPSPSPSPTATPTPEPTPEPTPTPTATPGCVLAGEPTTPIAGYANKLGSRVNEAMHTLRPDCSIGSRCVVTIRPQAWQALVEKQLREQFNLCAGQHGASTDEIAVTTSAEKPWEGFHIYAGQGWDDPSKTGTVVWSPGADRGAWNPPGVTPTPNPTPTANPTPTPPPVSGCPPPIPPHVAKIVVKRHNAFCANLDSTVKVYDQAYCKAVGFYDQNPCPVRLETDPNRAACDKVALGGTQTWSCSGGCEVYPCSVPGNCSCSGTVNTNPAQAIVMKTGTVKVCDAAGVVCGSLVIQ